MKSAAGLPRLSLWLLDRLSGWGDDYGAAGDFEEYYRALAARRGLRHARRACRRQVVAALPGYLKNVVIWSDAMLKHYFRVAVRNLWKHKGYSSINIGGLAVGLACALFILLWVRDETSYDRFHADADSIYRLEQDQPTPDGNLFHVAAMPYPLGPALEAEVPEVLDYSRHAYINSLLLRHGDKAFYETRVRAVDPGFFRIFSFPLIRGDRSTALARPDSLVLTESTAARYFGAADPLGATLTIDNARDLVVTGVLKDPPPNSSIRFDALVPLEFVATLGRRIDNWGNNDPLTFVRLQAHSDPAAAAAKISDLVRRRRLESSSDWPPDPEVRRDLTARISAVMFSLLPLTKVRLHGRVGFERSNAAREAVVQFSGVALIVLLIACLNFMNLSTARSARRAREIGLRKTVGARRKSLVAQHLGESILTAGLAGLLAFGLLLLCLPAFNALSGKSLALGAILNTPFAAGGAAVILFVGLISGIYPALVLSSSRPAGVLKGGPAGGRARTLLRKSLVVVQFGLSAVLLVGIGVVARQIDYLRHKALGYDKEQLIYIPMRGGTASSYDAFKADLLRQPRVLGVTATQQTPTQISSNGWGAEWEGQTEDCKTLIGFAGVDFDYVETLGIDLVAGRSFSRDFAMDGGRAFVVNEEVPKLMGLDAASAVGKRFKFWGIEGPIVGVIKDFHYQSVGDAIGPLAVVVTPKWLAFAIVRLRAGEIPGALEDVRASWRRIHPVHPFEHRFFDEDFAAMFQADERTGSLLKVFAGLAVAVAGLGLFGLAAFTAERRTREIGVRKVLGASSAGIVRLLSAEFVKWVLAANVLAWPIAYLVMAGWLRRFAYRAPIAWWLFAAAGAGGLVVALLSVGFQALRAAQADPVRALKYE